MCTSPRPTTADLSGVWNEVGRAIYRQLRRRGARHEHAEDLSQDVAVKAVEKGVTFSDAQDLTRWAHKVAGDLWIDATRKSSRRAALDLRLHPLSLAREDDLVIDKLIAQRVWAQLSTTDRQVLVDAGDPSVPPAYLKLFRARQRLEAAEAKFASVIVGIARLMRGVRVRGVVAVAAGVAVAVVLLGPEVHHGSSHDGQAQNLAERRAHPPGTSASPIPSSRPGAERRGHEVAGPRTAGSKVRLPQKRIVLAPTGDPLIDGGTEPSAPGDSIICLYNLPVVGTVCRGDPERIEALLPD